MSTASDGYDGGDFFERGDQPAADVPEGLQEAWKK